MIYGKRTRLRGAEKDDLPLFLAWVNDLEVTVGITIFLPMAMWEEEVWFENLSKRSPAERPLAIEMRDGDDWRLIGNSGFHDIDTVMRSAEVGIMLGDKSIWNQGYGTEVMQLLLKHGFETLNLNRIQLHVYEGNRWAIRAYEKVGFIHEGRKREAHYKNGRYEDIFIMSVLRSEWKKEK